MSSGLEIRQLNKSFSVDNEDVQVLKEINVKVNAGEFISIVGHSGCGKSTLLKIIAGLVSYEDGRVEINGSKITTPDIDRGMIFQEHRLLPWKTIEDNIALGLKQLGKEDRKKIVAEHLGMVKLTGFEKAYPHQLSGGMAQRAAIARALVNDPKILLLDEPFGALDALTRIQMQKEVLQIWGRSRTTMILVTHDIDEAIYLSDRIYVMSSRPGTIEAVIPVNIARPRDRGSADFAHIKKQVISYFFKEEEQLHDYVI